MGAAYLPPDTLREQIAEIQSLTGGPFNVNLFVPLPFEADPARIRRVGELLGPYRRELGIEDPGTPSSFEENFYDQLEVVLEERVSVFSFTFGSLGPELMVRLRENGTHVLGTATTVEEGIRLEGDEVDAVVAQGSEAGGHRGTFLGNFEDSLIGTVALVPQMVDALSVRGLGSGPRNRFSVPVIAAGGVMDGRGSQPH